MNEFKVGDCVTLKSGGPLMTIKEIDTRASGVVVASCTWFSRNKVKENWFPVLTLNKENEKN